MPAPAHRLARASSPYLRQHAHQPVAWFPWGEPAFEKARRENKPLLLSIGYSTCHWCHVMARESFSDPRIAELLNAHFIALKVDREEHPEIDHLYMTAYQALYGAGGGWPLNLFLTPQLHPFTGGTYFPPTSRGGRLGFAELLTHLQQTWEKDAATITRQAADGMRQLSAFFTPPNTPPPTPTPAAELLQLACQAGEAALDPEWGGLGNAPKFPQVPILRFLLNHGPPPLRDRLLQTCRHLQEGGLHDQLAGGFHRYAVDRQWRIPHFEKMLYDQALLLELFLDAWLWSREDSFAETARQLIHFVQSELRDEGGAFYAAQDAQSEGQEGRSFCWTWQEMENLLSPDEFALMAPSFGLTREGNFHDHSDPHAPRGLNVLHRTPAHTCAQQEQPQLFSQALAKLRRHRAQRPQPALDRKILSSWNGLYLAALTRASRVLAEPTWLTQAQLAFDDLWQHQRLPDPPHQISPSRFEGQLHPQPLAESDLALLRASRTLYEATLQPTYLQIALDLAQRLLTDYHDPEQGGFFQSPPRPDLFLRLKSRQDAPTPSESALATLEFLRLATLADRPDLRDVATHTLTHLQPDLAEAPLRHGTLLQALALTESPPATLILTPGTGQQTLLDAAFQAPGPHPFCLGLDAPAAHLARQHPPHPDGHSQALLCRDHHCLPPLQNPQALRSQLS